MLRRFLALALMTACARPGTAPVRIATHDNQRSAGALARDTLRVTLEPRLGEWHPQGESDSSTAVWAFAEPGKSPLIPGPLLRVPVGATVQVILRNPRPDSTLTVFGLQQHPGPDTLRVKVAPGATRTITFAAGAPGTYFYWGSFSSDPLNVGVAAESQLSGAFVVDPVGTPPPDKIYVIGIWGIPVDSTLGLPYVERFMATINGKSFPNTTPLNLDQGDTLRWRWINPTGDSHPIHLHGFYFNVNHRGGPAADTAVTPRAVATELIVPFGTFSGEWIASEPGNWVVHCHFAFHVSHFVSLQRVPDPVDPGGPTATDHSVHGMRGMVIPITIQPRDGMARRTTSEVGARAIRLEARSAASVYGKAEGVAFVLTSPGDPVVSTLPMFSAPLVLRRDEPVRITVVNRLRAPTAAHWHGLEIPSYPDGVPGWSGNGAVRAPPIAPGDSFVAAFTPPRAGTFIYHAHSNETFQIASGMYGALIVIDPHHYRPDRERLIVIGGNGPDFDHGRVNGQLHPDTITITAGVPYRFRMVQINVDWRIQAVLRRGAEVLPWRRLAKDGYDLDAPAREQVPGIWWAGPGETQDVEIRQNLPGLLTLEVRTKGDDGWRAVVPIKVTGYDSPSSLLSAHYQPARP